MSDRICGTCKHLNRVTNKTECAPCLDDDDDTAPHWEPVVGPLPLAPATSATTLLHAAAGHMEQRAATYDAPGGERSMQRTVAAFNAITGRDLTESEGWLLMQVLKDVRDRQRQQPHQDSLEDCVAYAALKAEARLKEKK